MEAFQNFEEDQATYIISNTFDNEDFLNPGQTATFNINLIEKWIEHLQEFKRLNLELLKARYE
jgi:hypothetical protein